MQRNFEESVSYGLSRLGKSHLQLKEEQLQAIEAVYGKKDVFVCLPTGFGKSICFQILPFLHDHKLGLVHGQSKSCAIIVSPLIALMVDQVRSLRASGVETVIMTSSKEGSIVDRDFLATEKNLRSASLVFSSPEALAHTHWKEILESPEVSNRVCSMVVDEAHCVSKWSKGFRPAYGSLADTRALLPSGTPLMACTATASRSVKKDIVSILEIPRCAEVTASPDRPNIFYSVKLRTDIEVDMLPLVTTLRERAVHTPRVLVYCQSLDMCADLYAHFQFELGEDAYFPPGSPHKSDFRLFGMFHAYTPIYNRNVILRSLAVPDGVVRVVFASIALGMGVNLRDVNTVLHYGAPGSLEDYFQESGRGGRSGEDAVSTVYWKPADCPVRKEPSTIRDHELISVRKYVENVTVCRRKWLLNYFTTQFDAEASRCCDNCTSNTAPSDDQP